MVLPSSSLEEKTRRYRRDVRGTVRVPRMEADDDMSCRHPLMRQAPRARAICNTSSGGDEDDWNVRTLRAAQQ